MMAKMWSLQGSSAHACVGVYVCVWVCGCVCICVCACMGAYVCVYVRTWVGAYQRMYIYLFNIKPYVDCRGTTKTKRSKTQTLSEKKIARVFIDSLSF